MKPLTIQGIVLVLMLVALPLTSIATTTGSDWLAAVGLGVFGLAALTPPVMRFVGGDDEDGDEADEAEADEAERGDEDGEGR